MLLKIHQRKADKNNTELYKRAVQMFVDELLSKSKQKRLKLKVIFKQFRGKHRGYCGYLNQISRNRYVIEINRNKDFPTIISTLAHELVHVKQGVLGKLLLTPTGYKWNGTLYKVADEDYEDSLLWEREAHLLEKALTKQFLATLHETI